MKNSLLGAHFSIAGGLSNVFDRAEKYGCRALQLFLKSPTVWKMREISLEDIEKFKKRRPSSSVEDISVHAGYLINLASPDPEKNEKSFTAFKEEIIRTGTLGLDKIILHPGSHIKTSVDSGIKRISENLKKIVDDESCEGVDIILETTSGQGDTIGGLLEDIARILELTGEYGRFGLCCDTCHIFSSGYDISSQDGYYSFISRVEELFGENFISVWHLNDSKTQCGSRVDRHEHIGEGFIGNDLFKLIMNDERFVSIPKIIETEDEKNGIDMNAVNFKKLLGFISPS